MQMTVIAHNQATTISHPSKTAFDFPALADGILGSEIGRTVVRAILEVFNPTETGTASNTDVIAQLERLGQLRTQGPITEEEFAAAKAKILGL